MKCLLNLYLHYVNILKNQKPLKNNEIIKSKREQKIFFDTVFDESEPSDNLKSALKEYNKLLGNTSE